MQLLGIGTELNIGTVIKITKRGIVVDNGVTNVFMDFATVEQYMGV